LKRFRDALRDEEFVVTAGLELEAGTTRNELEQATDGLRTRVNAFQIDDSRSVEGRMASLAAAGIVLNRGVDCIVGVSARDRNRVAVESEILGAAALGVTTLVFVRGEKFAGDAGHRVKGVFDLGAVEMLETAAKIGSNETLVAAPGFLLGTAVTVFRPRPDWRPQRLLAKLDAGAQLLQTVPCLDAELLHDYVQALIEHRVTHRASLLVEVPVLSGAAQIERLKTRFPGAAIPDAVTARMRSTPFDPRHGVQLAAGMLDALRGMPGVAGAHLTSGQASAIAEVLDAAA
jgi:methylenetetrahydrofolate reductase (NADPH)